MNLQEICLEKLKEKKLHEDKQFKKRLKWEIEETIAKEKENYFLDLYKRKVRYPKNENNLLICWLLGICKDYTIEEDPNCKYGEFPDIDSDFIPKIRDNLKEIWAPQTFGEDFVCNISNYTTFGLKSSLIDMVRVFGESRDEILAITKNLDAKDEDGKTLTWDMALKMYPEFKKYTLEHPDIARAAKKLLNRNRGWGIHAGGLIISSVSLSDFVPLIKRKDDPHASAWAEGLHSQDLQPVGLIKFDLLSNENLLKRAIACKLIKERHKVDGICNLPGMSDWTDVEKWRNDKKALEMANRADLKCIFQFDSEGIRKMVKMGGVTSFDDLVDFSALYRPGPMDCGMVKNYIDRKKGVEKFELHPLIEPILRSTNGVMVYQEQVMKILNIVGNIPLKDCENARKSISKKKEEEIEKYKELFIKNGQINLQKTEKELEALFEQIISFAGYGFNKSHSMAYTYLSGQMLYLKAHYPHEFYTGILSCETLSEKIKEYKMEAKEHQIEMHHLDINKSKETFSLIGDVIYFGFSNVKGIGEEPAKRIVANQPYQSFEDFLKKFGTDSDVVKRLIALRCFNDSDVVTLYKYADHVRNYQSKYLIKKKTLESSFVKHQEKFEEIISSKISDPKEYILAELEGENPFEDDFWKSKFDHVESMTKQKLVLCKKSEAQIIKSEVVTEYLSDNLDDEEYYLEKQMQEEMDKYDPPDPGSIDQDVGSDDVLVEKTVFRYYKNIDVLRNENRWKNLIKLWNSYQKLLFKQKNMEVFDFPKFASFKPDSVELTDELILELRDLEVCEKNYYGFHWIHELEKSPSYKGGMNFSQFKDPQDLKTCPVEMKVNKVIKKESKNKKGFFFYQIECEDETGEAAKMNVWIEDWERWGEEFKEGALLRVRVQPPTAGFPTYTFDSPPRHLRWKSVPKNKCDDFRVFVMKPAIKQIDQILTHDEVISQVFNG